MVRYILRELSGAVSSGDAFSSNGIDASQSADLSLNLSRDQVRDYKARGGSLEVLLVDGRVIILNDFFDEQGLPKGTLYLSSGGEIYRVNLSEGQGMLYFLSYSEEADGINAFDPLIFDESGMIPPLPAETPSSEGSSLLKGFVSFEPITWGIAGAGILASAALSTTAEGNSGDDNGGGDGGGAMRRPLPR